MSSPPALGRLLLRLRRLGDRRAEIEADLLDLYELRLQRQGDRVARRRYVFDALSLWKIRRHPSVVVDRRSHEGMETMPQDVLFTLRLFRRHASLFAATIAGLAVAIALSAAMFSIVKSMAFGEQVFAADTYRVSLASGPFTRVTGDSPTRGEWAHSDYSRLRAEATAITLVAAANTVGRYRSGDDRFAETRVSYQAVSGDYFAVVGMQASPGRILLPEDDRPQVRNAVVSRGFWMNVLGGDPSIIGRTVQLNDEAFTVVGVADRRHSMPSRTGRLPAIWITLTALKEMSTSGRTADAAATRALLAKRLASPSLSAADRDRLTAIGQDLAEPATAWNPAVQIMGRIRTGAAKPQAEAEVRATAVVLAAERSKTHTPTVIFEPPASRNRQTMVVGSVLMAIVGLVVLLACANVTNVLLASAAGRRREIATRLAIGASRMRIFRQLLTESVLLGLAASAIALFVARAMLPSLASMTRVPPAVDVSPDPIVYAFVGFLTIVVGVLAGMAPARYGYKGDVTTSLKVDQLSAPMPLPRARLRSILIGGQAAVSTVLLVLAVLLTRTLVDSVFVDAGYDVDRLITVSAGTAGAPRDTGAYAAYWSRMRDDIIGVPGVRAAGFASLPPFDSVSAPQFFDGIRVSRNETSPEYFDAIGIRLVRGRVYTADEVRDGAPVAVISASLARAFWDGDDPLGDDMSRVWGNVTPGDERMGMLRKVKGAKVIGVVSDATTTIERKNAPTIYLPLSEHVVPRLVVRASGNPAALAAPLREAIQNFDPRQRPGVGLPREGLRRELEAPKSLAMLAVGVGAIALVLAAIGLFGVTAFVVEQRTHEMSVRRALGATSRQLVELLLRDTLRPVAVGLVCGLCMSLAGGRIVQSVLYGASARDPLALIAASLVLIAAATLAVLVPARKAGRVDPAQLLKQG